MKLKLNKKVLKNLSNDNKVLPADMTPQVGGGITANCNTDGTKCQESVANCGPSDQGCATGDCGGGSNICGHSKKCASGFCVTDFCASETC